MSLEGFCRACLIKFDEPTELLQYCESNRRMFVYCTGIQVKRNDTFTFQLCKECYLNLKFSCKFKKQCRAAEKKFKSYLTLRKSGDNVDFNNYLKHTEGSTRIPIASSSTPVHQKNYDDDDNESTCTSIQNFMSDMLQGEEIPTEARIIREVIQEEADILDDSLDSHWLHDDLSVDNDLDADFNFGGFSTPHSINNDHYYTPRRLTNDEDDFDYTRKDAKDTHKQTNMPLLEIDDHNTINCDYTNQHVNPDSVKVITNVSNENDMPILDCKIEFDGIIQDDVILNEMKNECVKKSDDDHITVILNKGVASKVNNSPFTNELDYYTKKIELSRMKISERKDKEKSIAQKNVNDVLIENKGDILNQPISTKEVEQYRNSPRLNSSLSKTVNVDSPVKLELDQYINEEMKKKKNSTCNKNIKSLNAKCTIDRNLELALKNADGQEFSLDQLLVSPQVSINSGASTPTINKILFGNLTPKDSNALPNYKEKEPDSVSFIDEFLKEKYEPSTQEPPVKTKRKYIKIKDLNKLKKAKNMNVEGEETGASKKGYKDIERLKESVKTGNENQNGISESETCNEDSVDSFKDSKEDILSLKQDLDNISISNLLIFEGEQSMDLNYSIASDFLQEDKIDETKESEPFKRPFSPPDNKYDLDKKYCKICDKTYKSQPALKIHFLKKHKVRLSTGKINKQKLRVCPQCGKGFNDYSNFSKHVKQHEEPINLICKYCTLEFPTKGRFKLHMKCHADEISNKDNENSAKENDDKDDTDKNKLVCSYCGKLFKTAGNYNLHVRRHSGVYSHRCELCQKGFYRKYDLDVHMLKHNNEMPFQCEYCPNKYRYRYLLVGHMYRHLGKDKFKCEVCDVRFVSVQNLKQHYRTEMCARNRKALEEKSNADVTVTYKPVSCNNLEEIISENTTENCKEDFVEKPVTSNIPEENVENTTEDSNKDLVKSNEDLRTVEEMMEIDDEGNA